MNWTRIRNQLGKRSAIVGAGVAGFLVGAGGFVAAQIDDAPSAEQEIETANTIDDSPSTTDETVPDTTVADSMPDDSISPTSVDLTVPDITVAGSSSNSVPSNTVDDSTSSVPTNTIDDHGGERDDDSDDSTSSSVPSNTIDDSTSSVPTNTIDDHGGERGDDDSDDSTSSSVPSNTIDDSTSSSVPASLPAAFSQSYQSAGGSIAVTWTGTAFVLDSVSPAPGFAAEIEDQSWDRIRVDFEGSGDARIEVRLNDGQIRVRID